MYIYIYIYISSPLFSEAKLITTQQLLLLSGGACEALSTNKCN